MGTYIAIRDFTYVILSEPMVLEVAVYNLRSALNAQSGGADRVELCAGPAEGGATPSHGIIEQTRKALNIDVHVMIRPRGGDFIYSVYEFYAMKKDIEVCKRISVDGVVFGILTRDGRVDKDRCRALVELARPLKVTFHRAFDVTRDSYEALDACIELGIDRILTSGRQPKAEEGIEVIRECVSRANGKITIMPGSGVNASNARQIVEATEVTELHFSAGSFQSNDVHNYNHLISFTGNIPPAWTDLLVADAEKVRAVRSLFRA